MIDSEENNKFDLVVKGLRETGVLNCKQVKEYFVKGHQAVPTPPYLSPFPPPPPPNHFPWINFQWRGLKFWCDVHLRKHVNLSSVLWLLAFPPIAIVPNYQFINLSSKLHCSQSGTLKHSSYLLPCFISPLVSIGGCAQNTLEWNISFWWLFCIWCIWHGVDESMRKS